jgi:glutamate synthase (NADPH/NADH) large chain
VAAHAALTGSPVAAALLADWPAAVGRVTAVVPRDYKRVLAATRQAERDGRPVDEAIMEAARG